MTEAPVMLHPCAADFAGVPIGIDFSGYHFDFGAEFFSAEIAASRLSDINGQYPLLFDEVVFAAHMQFSSMNTGRLSFTGATFPDGMWFSRFSASELSLQRAKVGARKHDSLRWTMQFSCKNLLIDGAEFDGFVCLGPLEAVGRISAVGAKFKQGLKLCQTATEKYPLAGRDDVDWVTMYRRLAMEQAVIFDKAEITGKTDFARVCFGPTASFANTHFNGEIDFSGSVFSEVDFRSAIFDRPLVLLDARFTAPPSFIGVQPESVFVLPGPGQIRHGNCPNAIDRWRVLKHLASSQQSVEGELEYNAMELRARAAEPSEAAHIKLLVSLYEALSDFGRSIKRPAIAWGCAAVFLYVLCVGSFSPNLLYWHQPAFRGSQKAMVSRGTLDERAQAALVYSLRYSLALPVGGTEAGTMRKVAKTLWGQEEPPLCLAAYTALHSLVCAGLLFLMLLAVRNRFRIK